MDQTDMACIRATFALLLVFSIFSPSLQQTGGNQISFGNAQVSGNCKYITSFTPNGRCVVTTQDVDQKITAIRDDISRARLQNVAQNSILQSQIATLQDTDRKLSQRIDTIQRDLLAIRVATVQGTGSSSASNQNLVQLRNQLLQSIQNVDNRVTQLSNQYQTQSQTTSNLQQQVNQLSQENKQLKADNIQLNQDFNSLKQDMQALTTQVRALAAACTNCQAQGTPGTTPPPPPVTTPPPTTPATSAPGVTISPARVTKLEQDVQALTAALQKANQDIANLTADYQATTLKYETKFNDTALELQANDIRLTNAENTLQSQNQLFRNSISNLRGQVTSATRDVATMQNQVTALENTVQGMAASQKSFAGQVATTAVQLAGVQSQAAQQKATQTNLIQAVQLIDSGLSNLIASISPTSQSQLNTLAQSLQNVLNGQPPIVTTSIPGVSGVTLGPVTSAATTGFPVPPVIRTTKSSFPVPPVIRTTKSAFPMPPTIRPG